jgi:pyridoxamine 5'-phosphate oxidase
MMNKLNQPLVLLTAEEIRERIWQELTRCTADRHHEWRTPVLATIGLDGTPQARTVVLRQASKATQSLIIFTDRRTPKVAELRSHPAGVLTFWSKRLAWQCRIALNFKVLVDGPGIDAAWQRISQSSAAKDYLAAKAPGSPIARDYSSDEANASLAAHHLALLTGQISSIDWLELSQSAHRRIRFMPDSYQDIAA